MTLLDSFINLFQVEQSISRSHFIHFAIDAWSDHRGLARKTEVFQIINAFLSLLIMHHHSASFQRIVDFGGMETERRQIALIQHRLTIHLHSKGMRGVIDDFQVVLVGNSLDTFHITGLPITMHRHDGCGMGCDGCFNLIRVNSTIGRVNVHKDWLATIPPNGMGGGYKAIGCSDDFTRDTQSLQSCQQG